MIGLARTLPKFQYDPERGRFRHYLGRTVRNAMQRVLERPANRNQPLDTHWLQVLEDPRDTSDDPEWEREWIFHHYRTAMRKVRHSSDPRSIEVFEYYRRCGSTEETAKRFQMSLEAVHKVKQRIRQRLRDFVTAQIAYEDAPDGQGASG